MAAQAPDIGRNENFDHLFALSDEELARLGASAGRPMTASPAILAA